MLPFPHPAHRTGRADFPLPALGAKAVYLGDGEERDDTSAIVAILSLLENSADSANRTSRSIVAFFLFHLHQTGI